MFGRRPRCPTCHTELVVQTVPVFNASSGDCVLTVTPHYLLVCPDSHVQANIDADYPLRCQEWLIDDDLLQQVVPTFGRVSTCECPTGTPGAQQAAAREHRVVHKFRGQELVSTVRFNYTVVTCSGCGRPRDLGGDFSRCWAPLRTP
jgi:hypothetical protein